MRLIHSTRPALRGPKKVLSFFFSPWAGGSNPDKGSKPAPPLSNYVEWPLRKNVLNGLLSSSFRNKGSKPAPHFKTHMLNSLLASLCLHEGSNHPPFSNKTVGWLIDVYLSSWGIKFFTPLEKIGLNGEFISPSLHIEGWQSSEFRPPKTRRWLHSPLLPSCGSVGRVWSKVLRHFAKHAAMDTWNCRRGSATSMRSIAGWRTRACSGKSTNRFAPLPQHGLQEDFKRITITMICWWWWWWWVMVMLIFMVAVVIMPGSVDFRHGQT